MPLTLTRGTDSIELPDPEARTYRAVILPNRDVQITAARKKTVVKLGPDEIRIEATFLRLPQTGYDDLEDFIINILDWQVYTCTVTDFNLKDYDDMYFEPVPNRGIDDIQGKGGLHTVKLTFANSS